LKETCFNYGSTPVAIQGRLQLATAFATQITVLPLSNMQITNTHKHAALQGLLQV
jgi:hypothetical protein